MPKCSPQDSAVITLHVHVTRARRFAEEPPGGSDMQPGRRTPGPVALSPKSGHSDLLCALHMSYSLSVRPPPSAQNTPPILPIGHLLLTHIKTQRRDSSPGSTLLICSLCYLSHSTNSTALPIPSIFPSPSVD